MIGKQGRRFLWPLFAVALLGFATATRAADVQLSQFTDFPDPAVKGGTFTYTLRVENNAADTATAVVLTLPLPATTTFVSATGTGCSHNGAVPGIVTCALGDLLGTIAGGSAQTVTVTIRTGAATGATVNATATVTSSSADSNAANNSLNQTTTIDDGADLAVSKSGAPASVAAGGTVDWTVSSQNLGPNDAVSVSLSDTLPPTMTFQSIVSAPGWSCGQAAGVVTCTRASAAAGAAMPDVVIRTTVTGAATGTATNAVTISAATPEPVTANNTATGSVTVTPGTDLQISKTAGPNPATGGANVSFTLSPRNNGPFPATNITVTDTLPAGFSFVSATGPPGWTCAQAAGVVTCTRASAYSAGATDDLQIIATAPVVAGLTAFSNTATIASADISDTAPGNNSGSVNFNVLPDGVDLTVTKTKSPNPVAQGAQVTSRITVTNNGPRVAAAGTVQIVDTLGAGTESFVSFSGTNWSCSAAANVVTCTYSAALAVGAATSPLDIITTALVAGALTNTACAAYTGPAPGDSISGNNCAAPTTVTSTPGPVSPDLQMSKTATTANGNTTLEPGESALTYTLTVLNNGPGAATGMQITDAIPGFFSRSPTPGTTGVVVSGIVVSVTSTATFSCTTGATVSCTQTGGTLLQGDQAVFTIQVARPLSDGAFTNTASVTSTTLGDPNPANNSASVAVSVQSNADVEVVSKTPASGTVLAGTEAIYIITVRNNGPSAAANVSLVDNLCAAGSTDCNFTFISAAATGGGVCGAPVGNNLTCTWGSFANAQSETVTVTLMPNWQPGVAVRSLADTGTVSTTTQEKADGTDFGNNSKQATLTVNPASLDALINISDAAPAGPDPLGFDPTAPPGNLINLITYAIRITNRGPSLATGLTFTDVMTPPSGKRITLLGAATAPGGADTGICTNTGVLTTGSLTTLCTIGANIAANTTLTRYLTFRVEDLPVPNGDTYGNSATVTTNETDSNPANNAVTENTTVRVRADLTASKAVSANPVQLRQPFNWIITVVNNGPGDSQQTTLTDTIPAGMAFFGAAPSWTNNDGGSGTCSTSGQNLSCNFGLLRNAKTVTLTVPVRVNTFPAGGTTQNCATAVTSEVDPNLANNTNQCATVTVQRSSLAGTVYRDNNNNGAIDGGENGIPGTTVALTGTDAFGNAVSLTSVTNASGVFSFSDLSPSDGAGYTLTETQPVNFFDGRDSPGTGCGTASCGAVANNGFGSDAITGIQLAGNSTATGYLFGEHDGNVVSGFVYSDANNNGVLDAGEAGIAGVTITLTGTDFGPDGVSGGGDDVAVNRTATTIASGQYEFTGLRAGNYTVTETQRAGFLDGRETAGTVAGAACAGCSTAVNDRISNIVMPSFGITAANMNFADLAPASLAGKVFNDASNNGVLDPGEPGVPGVTVRLTGTDDLGSPVDTPLVTDASGNFSFINLRPGTYTLTETQPAGFTDGAETAGSLGGSTAVNDVISGIVVVAGNAGTGYLFAERGSGLSGRVYVDTNANGQSDAGETGIPNVTVTLAGTDIGGSSYNTTAITGATGAYSFIAVPQSNAAGYTLTEQQPAAWADGLDRVGTGGGVLGNDVITGIVLPGTTFVAGYDFGERGGSLAGAVYNDANNNGVRDAGEQGVQGVAITLTGTDINGNAINRTATTGLDGSYRFADLPLPNAGGYALSETQPAGFTQGTNVAGTLGGTVLGDSITAIALGVAGANGTGYNFGERVNAAAQVSGRVWLDSNHDRIDNEPAAAGKSGWIVEIIKRIDPLDQANFTLIAQTTTDAAGAYAFTGLLPNVPADATDRYEIRFRHPQTRLVYGRPISARAGVDLTYATIRNLQFNSGDNVVSQSLPLDPSGIVYDSITRQPVAGATVAIAGPGGFNAALHLAGGAANQSQVVAADGLYQFLLIPTAPAGVYTLSLTAPPGYTPTNSTIIPPCAGIVTVGAVPAPALVQSSNIPPVVGTPAHTPAACPGIVAGGSGTTQYFFSFGLTPGVSADTLNNHLPVDPVLGGAIIMQKTTPMTLVARGDLIPYTVAATNTLAALLTNINVIDQIPPGFRYRTGSANLNGAALEPQVAGRTLTWPNLSFAPGERKVFKLVLVVGSGVGEGDYNNQSWAINNLVSSLVSNVALATVRVAPDPTFDCSDIIGKVFDDKNANGYQDDGEPGIPNVRIATARGLLVTSDAQGRFHVTCPEIPDPDRGSNFVMKLDVRTLPSGYRLTTQNPGDVRLTRGKAAKLNFGAAIHRVVRVELADEAFAGGELKPEWARRFEALPQTLMQAPSVLRLAYRVGADGDAAARDRVKRLTEAMFTRWTSVKPGYALIVEDELVGGGKR